MSLEQIPYSVVARYTTLLCGHYPILTPTLIVCVLFHM